MVVRLLYIVVGATRLSNKLIMVVAWRLTFIEISNR